MFSFLLLGALAQAAPPPADDAVYFVLVDRFANGDPKNDAQVDLSDPAAFHGGDLRGLREHLPELAALGVKTVWLSPIFEMRTDKIDVHGAFHGYWVNDLGALEPRFGDWAELRRLRRAMDRQHLRLVLDMVWNHTGYDAALRKQHPEWYHEGGDILDWDNALQRMDHDVHGLPDLAVEQEEVRRWLLDHTRLWIDRARPDGLRIDAVRHMPLTFQARMAEDLRAVSPDLWLVGEVFEGDPTKLAASLAGSGYSAAFDFPLHYAMVDVFCSDRSPARLATVLSQDSEYGSLLATNPNALLTFLDNHDLPRILSACGEEVGRVQQAMGFWLTARGTPSITYGTEAGLSGAAEPDNRGDMRFEPHPLGQTLRALLALRAAHPALTAGRTWLLALEGDSLVYARVTADEAALIHVAPHGGLSAPVAPEALGTGAVSDGSVWVGADGLHTGDPPEGSAGVAVRFLKPAAPGGFAGLLPDPTAPPGTRTVVLQASGAPPGILALVGAGETFGAWRPSYGKGFDATGRLQLELPIGRVISAKLVSFGKDGAPTWEDGEDRTWLVGPGDGPLELAVEWRAP